MQVLSLQDGGTASVYYSDHMWRSNLNGVHFCSQTLETLIRAISEVGSSVIPEATVEPVKPTVEVLFDDLKNGSLAAKQNARRRLVELDRGGDPTAHNYLGCLPEYHPSWEAKFYAKQMGKRDFRDVTFEELSEHVPNLVLRNRLMKELSDLFELEFGG